tara:strand:+ start:6585 stop:7271 length:687 start_codon:yes stop_codon:yes gene_type:complete
MTRGNLSIELLGSASDFEKYIISAIEAQIDKAVNKSIKTIELKAKPIIRSAISDCDEMKSLLSGQLRGELGLSPSAARNAIDNISEAVSEAISFTNTSSKAKKGTGGLEVHFQPTSFSNVLSVSGSSYFYKKRMKLWGQDVSAKVEVDWLDWLLRRGDSIIVSKFTYKPQPGKGRSGQGKMEKGGGWRISPTYAGTLQDNFITRALQSKPTVKAISKVIQEAIKKNWD